MHRDAALDEEADGLGHRLAALELDRGAAGLGHDPGGVAERLLGRFLIAAERHVDDDQRAPVDPRTTAAPCAIIMSTRHRQGAVEAVDHHAERIADQQQSTCGSSIRAIGAV